MRLVIAVARADDQGRALVEWNSFLHAFQSSPVPLSEPEVRVSAQPMLGLAGARYIPAAHLPQLQESIDERAWLDLAPAFFDCPEPVRLMILLHETLHLKLQRGCLYQNHTAVLHLDSTFDSVTMWLENPEAPMFYWRRALALEAAKLVQEISVDRLVLAQYAQHAAGYFAARVKDYYCSSRGQWDEPSVWGIAEPPHLSAYRPMLLLVRVRAGVGLQLPTDLQHSVEQRAAHLNASASHHETVSSFVTKILSVPIGSDEPTGDDYMELANEILNT